LWPPLCVFLKHSLLGRHSSLWAIRVVRHPTLRRILDMEAFCAVGAVLPLPCGAPVSMFCFARPDRYALVKGDNTTERGASLRGRAATKLSDTGKTSAHNASLAPLRHCQGDTSSPFSSFCCPVLQDLPNLAGLTRTLPRDCQKWTKQSFLSSTCSQTATWEQNPTRKPMMP